MATSTLANPPHYHRFPATARTFAPSDDPKRPPEFRVFPSAEGEYPWRVVALATRQTISRHKSLSFALMKCARLNEQRRKRNRDPLTIAGGLSRCEYLSRLLRRSCK